MVALIRAVTVDDDDETVDEDVEVVAVDDGVT